MIQMKIKQERYKAYVINNWWHVYRILYQEVTILRWLKLTMSMYPFLINTMSSYVIRETTRSILGN